MSSQPKYMPNQSFSIGVRNIELFNISLLRKSRDFIEFVEPNQSMQDQFEWLAIQTKKISVSSCYKFLQKEIQVLDIEVDLKVTLNHLWCTKIPFKFLTFMWRLMLDRLRTKNNLLIRRVINGGRDLRLLFVLMKMIV